MRLDELRNLYEKVRIRYEATVKKAKELKSITVLIKKEELLKEVGSAIYFNSYYSANMEFESVEDYIAEILEPNLSMLPLVDKSSKLNGSSAVFLEFRPFDSSDLNSHPNTLMHHVGLGYLSSIKFSKLEDFPSLSVTNTGVVLDESKLETEILRDWYTSKIKKMIALLRNLETAVTFYLRKWKPNPNCAVEFSSDYTLVLNELENMFIKWSVPVNNGFGSDSDRVNVLKEIPDNLEDLLK